MGAVIVFAIGIVLNALDNKYNIKNSVKSGMRYALEHVNELSERASKISIEKLEVYAEKAATNLMKNLIDEVYDETKSWLLKKVQLGDLPLPAWPNAPELPNFSNFKLSKFRL